MKLIKQLTKEETAEAKASDLSYDKLYDIAHTLAEGTKTLIGETLNFLQEHINYREYGVSPTVFSQKAHLGKHIFNDVVNNRKRELTAELACRLAIGIAICWDDIVHKHLAKEYPCLHDDMKAEKEEDLKTQFIIHMGCSMRYAFLLKEQGKDLDAIARFLSMKASPKNKTKVNQVIKDFNDSKKSKNSMKPGNPKDSKR